jgi:two-component system sensor histidine kinase VicK
MSSAGEFIKKTNAESLPPFLAGGGEMGELLRSIDWTKTALGSPELWPQSLKTAVGIMLHNKFGMYIAWGYEFTQLYNDAYRPILGRSKHPSAMGDTTDKTFAESWHIIGPLFQQVMKGNAVGSEDWMLPLDRHGYLEECYFTYSYSPIHDETGNVGGVLVTVTETTQRVRSEKLVREAKVQAENAKADLQELLAQAPVGIAKLEGPEHVFTLTNSTYLSMLFDKNPNFLGKSVREAIPEAIDQGFVELLDHVYQTGQPFVGKETPISLRQQDGSEKQLFLTFIYQPVKNINGEVSGILCVVYDVTEQVETRRKIEDSQTQFSTLANSIPQLAWMARADGYIYWYNKNWFDYTGTTIEQMKGWGWESVHDPKELPTVMRKWPQAIQTGEPFVMEFPLKRHDGKFRWFLTRAVPLKDGTGKITGWIGSNTDIDAQKIMISALESEKAMREQFVSTLTHDLRTPLAAVRFNAQLLSRRSNTPEKLTNLSGRIVDNVDRANQMIENLLDANRIKAGEPLALHMQDTALVSIVTETLDDLSTVLGDQVVLDCMDAAINGVWNANAVRRIIDNLCSNAFKYGRHRSPITVSLRQDSQTAIISVHNLGNPIPSVELEKLFDPFRRASTAGNHETAVRGWGLGLTLVKGFTEAHHGRIEVTSSEEKGTTFTVILPKDAGTAAIDEKGVLIKRPMQGTKASQLNR